MSHTDGAVAPDPYYKKTITYRYCRKELRFDVSQELFSSYQIDAGTQLLLRSLTPDCSSRFLKVLDLGCGYGALGLTLKALNPDTQVHLADRDALAIEFARRNAALNHCGDVQVYGTLDYSDVRVNDFDLVVGNIPGKAGAPVIARMLEGAQPHLAPEGIAAVVAVKPLEDTIDGLLGGNPAIEVLKHEARSQHLVVHYRFKNHHGGTQPNHHGEIEESVYYRGKASFSAIGHDYKMQTVYGLPEFDQLSYATKLLLGGLKQHAGLTVGRCLIHNPGIGHVPVVLWNTRTPAHMSLVDRDLLSLRCSRRNLVLNGCPDGGIETAHRHTIPSPAQPYDLVLAVLRDSEGPDVLAHHFRQLAESLTGGGVLLLAGTSTAITRLVDRELSHTQLKVRERERYRGFSLLALGG